MTETPPPCGICGKPSTHGVRDIRKTSKPSDEWETYEHRGEARFRCDQHRTQYQIYDQQDRLIGVGTDDQGRPIPF